MDAEFGNSKLVATIGLSMFVLGIALGPVWSPLSEFYGRRPIYLAAFATFTVFIIPCAVAKNIETVIIARFFQGLAGSAFLSVAGGTVGDLFTPNDNHYPMTVFTMAPCKQNTGFVYLFLTYPEASNLTNAIVLGPSTGPLVGGFINT